MDKNKIMGIAKIGVILAGAGISLAKSWFDQKDLDETVAKKVAEELAKSKAGES